MPGKTSYATGWKDVRVGAAAETIRAELAPFAMEGCRYVIEATSTATSAAAITSNARRSRRPRRSTLKSTTRR